MIGAAATFWELLEARARHTPDRLAFLHGARAVTFGEWHALANRYAQLFTAAGGRPGDRALVWMDSSPEMAAAMLGVWKAGGLFALMDPRARADHYVHAIDTIDPSIVFGGAEIPASTSVPVVTPDAAEGSPSHDLVPWNCLPVDPASIVFTSGSTGKPKGVTQSHGNLLRGCRAVGGYLGLGEADRLLCTVPWSYDYGYGQLLSTLLTGAVQVLPSAPNPLGICEAIERHHPTVLAGIPSVFTYLLRGVSPFRTTNLSSIRMVTNTGGTIPAAVLHELTGLLPGRRIFLNYGLTETYRTSYLDPSLVEAHPTSIGRPIPGVAVAIVREDGSPAAPGEVGEIVHRGDYVCLGYWNNPEATARSVRPDPLAVAGCPRPAMALFTGDLGRIDTDGLLYFCGRRDRQLKPMGVRVNPSEIEEAVYASGLVREVGVLGRKHELLGDEIWAFVVPTQTTDDGAALVQRLRVHARATVSPYMVPQRFIVTDALPKTTSGKIDYPSLADRVTDEQ